MEINWQVPKHLETFAGISKFRNILQPLLELACKDFVNDVTKNPRFCGG